MCFSLHTFLLGVRNIHIRRLFLLVWRSLSRSGPRVLFVPLTVGRKPAAKDCPIICPYIPSQGCGLGLEVSISRQSRDLTTSRLGESAQHLGLGPIRLGPRLSLGPKRLGVLSRSRAISCRWSRRFVWHARSVAQYSRRRPIQTNLP